MNTISVESKLPGVGISIFSVMSALAAQHGAINLSQGFPDFDCDPRLIELVTYHLRAGHNQYAPAAGLPKLRDQIANLAERTYGAKYNPETEITVTSGATEALYCAIAALVSEGDEVILFEPAYDSYAPAVVLNGGIPVYCPLEFPNYSINWSSLKKRINSKTRLIILNSPQNPTGAVLKKADVEELQKIISSNEIFIISDEVYEHLIFDGKEHQSLAQFPGLRDRTFLVSSFGKSFHSTGWKVGYCMGPEPMMAEFRKIHQFNVFSTATPFQWAIADFMEERPSYFSELSTFYQEKRDLFRNLVQGSRFEILPCNGTYFQLLGYGKITDEKDEDFARRMTIEHKLASIPVSVFYKTPEYNKVLRFCFAKNTETLEKAAEVLQKM